MKAANRDYSVLQQRGFRQDQIVDFLGAMKPVLDPSVRLCCLTMCQFDWIVAQPIEELSKEERAKIRAEAAERNTRLNELATQAQRRPIQRFQAAVKVCTSICLIYAVLTKILFLFSLQDLYDKFFQ